MAVLIDRKNARTAIRKWFGRCLALAVLAAPVAADGVAQERLTSQWSMTNTSVTIDKSTDRQAMQMVVNTSREIKSDQNFKQVRIENPNVISALPLEGNRLQISAVATGVTRVDLLGADDSVHTIEVMVLGDVRELEAILRQTFPDSNLSVVPVQQGCIVSGYVTNDTDAETVARIAELYFPTVINKIQVTGVHTIQLEVQIMEVSRTKLRELGIDWALSNGNDFVANSVGDILTSAGTTFGANGTETFQLGVIENSTQFFTAIKALKRNNLVKVLANPTLTAVDGRPASFNAGGEIPIVIPSGLGQITIQYREYGTRLDYVAKVRGAGRIWLEVRPYVSEIDPARAVTIQGFDVPALRSRFLETGVEMGAGQTLALAGLLQVRTESVMSGLPFFSDMPYIGAFFRSVHEEQNEIELLISMTPNFAGPMNANEVPNMAPGVGTQSPTDKDLYLRGYLETPVDANGYLNSAPQLMNNGNGMFESIPYGAQYQGTPSGQFQNVGPASMAPVPNPAAMSIGPNAPKLAQKPQYLPPVSNQGSQQPSFYSPNPSQQNGVTGGKVVR